MASQLFQQLQPQQTAHRQYSVQDIVKEVQQSGMSAQELFYKKIKDSGQNPDSIINQAMQYMSNMR